jgi:deoxycytidylate deaminase
MNGFMKLARNISLYSTFKYRVGAVIVKKNIISVGFNQQKSHPIYSIGINTTVHAEMGALIHAQFDNLSDSVIYVYREDRQGFPAIARPCEKCLQALKEKGVKKMVYSISEYPFYRTERI